MRFSRTVRFLPRFRALRTFVVLASALVFMLGGAIWLRTTHAENAPASVQQTSDSPYHPTPLARTQRPTALFVGDDFTAGYGGIGRNAYPRMVCDVLRMNCNVDAQAGTGLIDDGRDFSDISVRLIDRLPADQRLYTADVVIVDAGRNDLEVAPEAYGKALEQFLLRVTKIWSDAKIVVIAPSYLSSNPDSNYDARISVISNVVKSFHGILIDPLAERWYEGADVSTLLLFNNVHPNQTGHEFIAEKLEQSLRNRGIGQEGLKN